MSAQPQRTLVSRKRYIQVMGLKLSLFAVGAGTIGGGLIAGFAVMNEIVISLVYPHETRFTLLDCTAFAVGAGMLLMCGAVTYRKSHKIAAVELTTPQNAHLLPVQETLVRASDRLPSQPQTELLRAHNTAKRRLPTNYCAPEKRVGRMIKRTKWKPSLAPANVLVTGVVLLPCQ